MRLASSVSSPLRTVFLSDLLNFGTPNAILSTKMEMTSSDRWSPRTLISSTGYVDLVNVYPSILMDFALSGRSWFNRSLLRASVFALTCSRMRSDASVKKSMDF